MECGGKPRRDTALDFLTCLASKDDRIQSAVAAGTPAEMLGRGPRASLCGALQIVIRYVAARKQQAGRIDHRRP